MTTAHASLEKYDLTVPEERVATLFVLASKRLCQSRNLPYNLKCGHKSHERDTVMGEDDRSKYIPIK
jgi:hypothetical protein